MNVLARLLLGHRTGAPAPDPTARAAGDAPGAFEEVLAQLDAAVPRGAGAAPEGGGSDGAVRGAATSPDAQPEPAAGTIAVPALTSSVAPAVGQAAGACAPAETRGMPQTDEAQRWRGGQRAASRPAGTSGPAPALDRASRRASAVAPAAPQAEAATATGTPTATDTATATATATATGDAAVAAPDSNAAPDPLATAAVAVEPPAGAPLPLAVAAAIDSPAALAGAASARRSSRPEPVPAAPRTIGDAGPSARGPGEPRDATPLAGSPVPQPHPEHAAGTVPATEPPGRTPADALRANDARGGATIAKRGKQLELDGREEAQGSVTPTPPPPAAAGTTPAPAEPRTEPTRTRPVAPPLPALPVEPGEAVVSGAVLPAAAHLHLSSETLGELALHLRIQDGAAHVRVEGGSRAAVEARTPELVRALAAEGLGLARLEHEPRNAQPPGGAGTSGDLSRDGNGGSRDASERHGGAHAGDEPPPRSSSSRTEPRAARGASRTHGGSHDVTA